MLKVWMWVNGGCIVLGFMGEVVYEYAGLMALDMV